MKRREPFDKYFYYKKSVQSPKEDIRFFKRVYKSFFKKNPKVFREDFCGTFYVGYHWVKGQTQNLAIVVDKDREPIEYGKAHHLPLLKPSESARLTILNKDVLTKGLPKAEIISVSNFSYFVLKERDLMLKYFKNVRKALFPKGLFIIDAVGGPDCEGPIEETVNHGSFKYYWDQYNFNPIQQTADFYIHFKRKGERKRKKVFHYSWRLWSLPELKDILHSAGFSEVHIYWEGTDSSGEGTGTFRKKLKGEPCDSWIAYLVCRA